MTHKQAYEDMRYRLNPLESNQCFRLVYYESENEQLGLLSPSHSWTFFGPNGKRLQNTQGTTTNGGGVVFAALTGPVPFTITAVIEGLYDDAVKCSSQTMRYTIYRHFSVHYKIFPRHLFNTNHLVGFGWLKKWLF